MAAALLTTCRDLHGLSQPHYHRAQHHDLLPAQHAIRHRMVRLLPSCHLHDPNSLHSCGVPLFANATSTKCKQCEKGVPLSINPRIVSPPPALSFHIPPLVPLILLTQIGPLTDETGNIATGKLIWSPEAWEQLLGRTASEFVSASTDVLKYLEHRMLFMRVTVMFGWSEEVGKLCICGVSM